MAPKRPIEEAEEDESSWLDFTVAQLKVELEARGLSKTGRKDNLIARLEADDAGNPRTSIPGQEPLVAEPKPKKLKRAVSPEIIEGASASEVMVNQHRHRETGETRLREFVPEPDDKFKAALKKIRKERMVSLPCGTVECFCR